MQITAMLRALVLGVLALPLMAPAQGVSSRTASLGDHVYAVTLPVRTIDGEPLVPARSVFVVGPRGVIVVDTGLSHADGMRILDAIEVVTAAPVRLAILTHPSQEAIFGASAFHERGIPVAMHADAAALIATRCEACLVKLRGALGEAAMAHTRVLAPDRLLRDGEVIVDHGRRLRVIAPPHTSAPGAIALLDEASDTLIAGSMAPLKSVPDLRDANVPAWRAWLDRLQAMHCRRLVPAYGSIGTCEDIPSLAGYLEDLDTLVMRLLAQGVTLAELDTVSGLPRYETWGRYSTLHRANVGRTYLRLEKAALDKD